MEREREEKKRNNNKKWELLPNEVVIRAQNVAEKKTQNTHSTFILMEMWPTCTTVDDNDDTTQLQMANIGLGKWMSCSSFLRIFSSSQTLIK